MPCRISWIRLGEKPFGEIASNDEPIGPRCPPQREDELKRYQRAMRHQRQAGRLDGRGKRTGEGTDFGGLGLRMSHRSLAKESSNLVHHANSQINLNLYWLVSAQTVYVFWLTSGFDKDRSDGHSDMMQNTVRYFQNRFDIRNISEMMIFCYCDCRCHISFKTQAMREQKCLKTRQTVSESVCPLTNPISGKAQSPERPTERALIEDISIAPGRSASQTPFFRNRQPTHKFAIIYRD
jgi:hypothetical protein